jgi:hypothetical protein
MVNNSIITNRLAVSINLIPPTLILIGAGADSNNLLTWPAGNNFVDPGITALDYTSNLLNVYIISLVKSGMTNIITLPILITGTTTVIPNTNTLTNGDYTITYLTTDAFGNSAYKTRIFNIYNPMTPWSSSIVINSFIQSSSTNLIPVFSVSPNLWYWPSPYNTNGFGGSGISWGLSQSYLTSIKFSYTSSWCFVIKLSVLSINTYINCYFNAKLSYWTTLAGQNIQSGSVANLINNFIYSPFIGGTTNISPSISPSNFFINIFYNYSTSILQFQLINMLGNVIINDTVLLTYTCTDNTSFPFYIYNQFDAVTYYNGIYYSKSYANYSNFASFFP